MNEMKPQMGPGGSNESAAGSGNAGSSAPGGSPPAAASTGEARGDCGCGGSGAAAWTSAAPPPPAMGSVGEAAPSVRPADGVASGGVTAWQNNKRITGLWSINQNRNSWVHVDGVGWKKLANNSDSAIVALTALGAHAREKASVVNYREESDGLVREMYVW